MMNPSQSLQQKYAQLIVKTGLNLQKGQILVINSPLECAEVARGIAEVAYQEGAHDVVILWKDELFAKIRYLKAPLVVFDEFPQWQKDLYSSYAHKGAAFLSIAASDPELFKDVDPLRLSKAQIASQTALKDYRERLMSNKNPWCVVSVPSKAWAEKVFPGLTPESAIEKLWQAIYQAVRVDQDDPVASWEKHKAALKYRTEYMNDQSFRTLHYRNNLGTDLTIELPPQHRWIAGAEVTPEGIEFIANIPTEEIFTLPSRNGVNGIVYSSKPLQYQGNLIENFSLRFEQGRIIEYKAEKGYESLKNLIETDEGSHYLGEVALVPYDSPISNSRILFYNTLFDENASSHLAIGKAYPVCFHSSEAMTEDELLRSGVNDSLTHEDFMIGTADLEIIGIKADGTKMPVFRNGNFAF